MQPVSVSVWFALSVVVAVALVAVAASRKLAPGLTEVKARLDGVLGKLGEERKLGEDYRLRLQQDQREIAQRDEHIAGFDLVKDMDRGTRCICRC